MKKNFVVQYLVPIFAVTVLVLHPLRSAHGSLLRRFFYFNDNKPSMPLCDAHLGGLFFLGYA